jgi:hypothetical protein
MRVIAVLMVALSLGGCLSDQEVIAERAAKDDQKCLSYGARPGSDAYVTCRAQLDSARTTARAIDGSAPAPAPVQIYGDTPKLQNTLPPGPRCTSRGC